MVSLLVTGEHPSGKAPRDDGLLVSGWTIGCHHFRSAMSMALTSADTGPVVTMSRRYCFR